MSATLYRMWNAKGALLYVGISESAMSRFAQHAANKDWWGEVEKVTLEHFPNREFALVAELTAIQSENPRYNIAGRPGAARRQPAPKVGATTPDLFPDLPDPVTPGEIIAAGIRSRSQLNRDISAGKLRAYKVGSRLFIAKGDLLSMVQPVRAAS